MYAVIATGGKQYRVEEGQRIAVERLAVDLDSEVELRPVLLVDGDATLATPAELAGVSVTGRVVGEAKGPKINGFNYKAKARVRRRWGHRQQQSVVEITKIAKG